MICKAISRFPPPTAPDSPTPFWAAMWPDRAWPLPDPTAPLSAESPLPHIGRR